MDRLNLLIKATRSELSAAFDRSEACSESSWKEEHEIAMVWTDLQDCLDEVLKQYERLIRLDEEISLSRRATAIKELRKFEAVWRDRASTVDGLFREHVRLLSQVLSTVKRFARDTGREFERVEEASEQLERLKPAFGPRAGVVGFTRDELRDLARSTTPPPGFYELPPTKPVHDAWEE